jgi:thiol-disulfide isomerase/thioredoxin
MKKITLLFVLLLFAGMGMAQLSNVEVRDLNRKWVSIEDLKGEQLTVVDFWATWCKPCVAAIPKLNVLAKEYKNKGVNFVGVNVDGPRNQAKIKPFVRSLNINYATLLDPNQELVNELNVTAFPTLLIFDSQGKELFVHEGFAVGDEEVIRAKLDKILSE